MTAVLVLAAWPASAQQMPLRERMIVAEDRRAPQEADLAALKQGLADRDPRLRTQAVKAIGRLERPDLIPTLTRSLGDDNLNVRIEAANAIGQLAKGEEGVAAAKPRLLARTRVEKDPRAWAAVAATLGRLPYTAASDVAQVEEALAKVLPSESATAIQIDAVLGAAEGLEALARQSGKLSKFQPGTLRGLRAAAALEGRAQDADKLARIRRLATLALTAAGGVARPQLEAGAKDPDAEVRRLIMAAARTAADGREDVLRLGLSDDNPRVRYEALQTWGRTMTPASCAPVLERLADRDPHVVLLALDLLGARCGAADGAAERLRAAAAALTPAARDWHRPAHALVSLAQAAPADARALLPRFTAHEVWQVRMYAARAAARVEAWDSVVALAGDAHHNVREAALAGLVEGKRPEAAALGLAALAADDYQLVMTAARAAAMTADRETAIAALTAADARIAAAARDTSRDARTAIREALTTLGGPALPAPQPQPFAISRVSLEQLDALKNVRLRFTMRGVGIFDLRLLPDDAPVTALHIATLAREGYYQGLTFHRVVPNFVIQGGSPGANEYAGQGPFMRDEVGLVSHRRGTVGISTRGRDTGDAQIFINLVDSPRLDHLYTVFAEVVAGMDVVDQILEGDVIERVEVVTPSS